MLNPTIIQNQPISSRFDSITPAEMDARIHISSLYAQRVLENFKLAKQNKKNKKSAE